MLAGILRCKASKWIAEVSAMALSLLDSDLMAKAILRGARKFHRSHGQKQG